MNYAKLCDRCDIPMSYKLMGWFTGGKACINCMIQMSTSRPKYTDNPGVVILRR